MTDGAQRRRTALIAAAIVLALLAGILLGLWLPKLLASRREAAAQRSNDAAVLRCTARNHVLTNTQFAYYYWSEYFYFLDVYSEYLGDALDADKPLDEQPYDDEQSWQDYMIERALETARDTASMVWAAEDAGFTLDADDEAAYEQTLTAFRQTAADMGYDDLTAYLRDSYGAGADEESFCRYLHDAYVASSYAAALEADIDPDAAAVQAYLQAHAGEYADADDAEAEARADLIAETYQNLYRSIVNAETFEVDYSKIALTAPKNAPEAAKK